MGIAVVVGDHVVEIIVGGLPELLADTRRWKDRKGRIVGVGFLGDHIEKNVGID